MVVDLDSSIRLVDVRDGAPLGEPIWGSGVGFGLSGFAPDGSVVLIPAPPARCSSTSRGATGGTRPVSWPAAS